MGFFYSFLGQKSITIGRDESNDIVIKNTSVSHTHLVINIFEDSRIAGLRVCGKAGVIINGRFHPKGDRLLIGLFDSLCVNNVVMVFLKDFIYFNQGECKNVVTKHDFRRQYSLVTRVRKFTPAIRRTINIDTSAIEIEGPPVRKAPEKPSIVLAAGPALTMAIPILLGAGRKLSVLTSVFAAIWAMTNVIGRHRKLKNEERKRKNTYYNYINECEKTICERCRKIAEAFSNNYPDIEKYLIHGGNPFLVWNKETESEDSLMIRIGIGPMDNPVKLVIPKEKFMQVDDSLRSLPTDLYNRYRMLENVPICIDCFKHSKVGVIYDDYTNVAKIVSALILQFAVLMSPDRLSISGRFYSEELYKRFIWMRYLPHTVLYDGAKEDDKNITKSIELYDEQSKNDGKKLIVITDDRNVIEHLKDDGDTIIVLLRRKLTDFAAQIDLILSIRSEFMGIINLGNNLNCNYLNGESNGTEKIAVIYDKLILRQCEEYARQLACMYSYSPHGDLDIPDNVSFDSMFGKAIDESVVVDNWKNNNIIRSIEIPIGVGTNGKVITLDLHEKKAGPHGLVAGATGSGKSELLTTMILAASLQYPPDKLGFFLIDYKGGGMSNLFAGLPHLLGSVSNLTPMESNRALISLKSENIKRQIILNDSGVNNINDYIELYDLGKVTVPLPHVLIIVDEFAELRKEQPEYMSQLISIAAVGRSLGIHLILATQKPGGVVDDRIRSNSKFRICLRVEDAGDSQDMLKKKDAADIRICGRGYLQVGNDEIYEQFQCGYAMGAVSGKSRDSMKVYDGEGNRVSLDEEREDNRFATYQDMEDGFDRSAESKTECFDEVQNTSADHSPKNCFEHCMNVISNADKITNFRRPDGLWMEALPSVIHANWDEKIENFRYAVADDVYNQRYEDIVFYPENNQNIYITGGVGSGKSTMITTILAGLSICACRKDVSYYIIDFGGGKLSCFAKSKVCGGYISELDSKKVAMMLYFINDLIKERRYLCTRKEDRSDVNHDNEDFSTCILVIDNYLEAVKECYSTADRVIGDIIKYGKNVNVSVIISALGTGQGELPGRISSQMDKIFILGNHDPYIAAGLLKSKAGNIPQIPELEGRGICCSREQVLEFQTLLAGYDRSINLYNKRRDAAECEGYDKASSIENILEEIVDRANSFGIFEAREYSHIPDDHGIEVFLQKAVKTIPNMRNFALPAGYEEETGRIYTIDLRKISCALICGKSGTGRKTFLQMLSIVAARYGIYSCHISTFEGLQNVISNYKSKFQMSSMQSCMEDYNKSHHNYHQSMIITIPNFDEVLEEAYRNRSDAQVESLLCDLCDNTSKSAQGICIIAITTDRIKSICPRGRLYNSLMKKPYVIHFGGCLDENRLVDFSYLPYSVQSKKKAVGHGTILKYDEKHFYGGVVFPALVDEED